MRTGFYLRLALNNIRKNRGTYFPYILTCAVTVMMFYMVKSLSLNPGIRQLTGADTIAYTMALGARIIGLFALIFLFYTNSFLMKRRKKEFGLFNILGMEKRHLARVLFLETFITVLISLCIGIVFGIALDKFMFLVLTKIIGGSVVLGFFVSGEVIRTTAVLFGIIFALIYLKSVLTIGLSNPIELLRGGNVGEREPKAKWVLALLGAVMLGIAYYLALTIKNPVASINAFFIAVLLVIAATYLLFTAGSIVVLKLMRKNKKFYYKAKHFIGVSGMIYRMKQNAAGLANICILSTMVLVTVSSTTSMMVGLDDIQHTRYPNNICIYSRETDDARNDGMVELVDNICYEMEVPIKDKIRYSYMTFSVIQQGNTFGALTSDDDFFQNLTGIRILIFLPLSDYNTFAGENRELGDHDMLIYSSREKYTDSVLYLFGEEWHIAERLKKYAANGVAESNIATSYYCIVRDEDYDALIETTARELGEYYYPEVYYGLDMKVDKATERELYDRIRGELYAYEFVGYAESRQAEWTTSIGVYGGLFFLGIFLGVLFIMAAVLIIYYKQISEGYDDRERFVIMRKVGMTQAEIKGTIRSQVLTVFFLPLIAAGIHVAVAFPMISLILALLNMTNVSLYLICTMVCFLVFAGMYVMVYSLTARTYYKIVSS
ncbi:MAG: ABC transporter permease [Lachnospiraceae bacterium]|nr:ABC transporter permease [Lachnospiraceae bacterium]